MTEKNTRQEALQMSRDLARMIDQESSGPTRSQRDRHVLRAVDAADQSRELADAGEYEGAAAFAAVAQAYAAIAREVGANGPVSFTQPKAPTNLPAWCGECDGPEVGRRWVAAPIRPGEEQYEPRLMRCPRCGPQTAQAQDAHQS